MRPLEISEQTAKGIIENRKPLGTFYIKGKNVYVGIDNSEGDSFVEEFKDLETCLAWLNYDFIEYHTVEDFGKSLEQLKQESEERHNKPNYYEVVITEKLVTSININANSKDEAIEKAKELYDKEEIVLAYDDFSDVEFK